MGFELVDGSQDAVGEIRVSGDPIGIGDPGVVSIVSARMVTIRIGPQEGDVKRRVTFDRPFSQRPIVICNPRSAGPLTDQAIRDRGNWGDQFGVQVFHVDKEGFDMRIRRLDVNGASWGNDLMIDVVAFG